MVEMAANDPSVRLRLSSAAQKLPPRERWPLLTALVSHAGDDGDHNLPLMNRYAAEPAVAEDTDKAVRRQARELSLLFGSDAALAGMRAALADGKAAPQVRRKALAALLGHQDTATLEPLLSPAAAPGPLRVDAVKALANYDDPRISSVLIGGYGALTAEEKSATLVTLVTRGGETLTEPKEEIANRDLYPSSMMPAGLLAGLQEPEVRDLFPYLRQSKNP